MVILPCFCFIYLFIFISLFSFFLFANADVLLTTDNNNSAESLDIDSASMNIMRLGVYFISFFFAFFIYLGKRNFCCSAIWKGEIAVERQALVGFCFHCISRREQQQQQKKGN